MNFTILRFDTLDSTNTEAANQARLGADEGVCVVASQQNAGRGRFGRSWVSPRGSGLYFSLVLRPRLAPQNLSLITLMAGVAVHDALRELGIVPDIKWVNDVLVNDQKISGILAESVETRAGLAVIVGIGINLDSRNFPKDLATTATSVYAETGQMVDADHLVGMLIKYLSYFYGVLNETDGARQILRNWQQRSTYFSGKSVRAILPDGTVEGITDGLEENGSLRVKTSDGSVRIIQAGDVERLRRT